MGTTRKGAGPVSRDKGQRGSATVFTASLALVLVVVGTAAVMVVALMLAGHRARSGADLAALAAASAEVSGLEPCAAARANSRQNGARVTACEISGGPASFVVTVTVSVDTGLARPLPVEVKAIARAGNVHDDQLLGGTPGSPAG